MAITQQSISKALDWAYEKAIIRGVPCIKDAYELAAEFMKGKGELQDQVNLLVRWQNTKVQPLDFSLVSAVLLRCLLPFLPIWLLSSTSSSE